MNIIKLGGKNSYGYRHEIKCGKTFEYKECITGYSDKYQMNTIWLKGDTFNIVGVDGNKQNEQTRYKVLGRGKELEEKLYNDEFIVETMIEGIE